MWILESISSTSISILVNGCLSDEFKLRRELRQDGPLSSFLFLICGKRLNFMLNALVDVSLFVGYKVNS